MENIYSNFGRLFAGLSLHNKVFSCIIPGVEDISYTLFFDIYRIFIDKINVASKYTVIEQW